MPLVQKYVKDFFGKEPRKDVNPDEAVAVALRSRAVCSRAKEGRACCSTSLRCRSASRRSAAS